MNSTVIPIFVTYRLEVKQFIKLNELWNKVIFVDNSETKLSDIRLRQLNIIWNKMNLGYGGGANVGIEQALKLGADWVIIMNQDLTITRKGLERLIDKLTKCEAAIVGPFTGKLDSKRWSTMLPAKQVDYISGACMAIHREVIEKVGNFYEPYFMYYEDVDYCVEAKKFGFPLIKLTTSDIKHDDSSSLGKGSFLHEYYLSRNHLLFVERQAPPSIKFREWLRLLKTLVEYLIYNNKGGSVGLSDYLLHRFGQKI